MSSDLISEPAFLITELRYTVGQLHVQVLDLDDATRTSAISGNRSIDAILRDMLAYEQNYLQQYSRALNVAIPSPDAAADSLPFSDAEANTTIESQFESARAQTIALLEAAGETWPAEVLNSVKEQVTHDRRSTTEVAECRKAYFDHDQRPDLDVPLTDPEDPTPHELTETQ